MELNSIVKNGLVVVLLLGVGAAFGRFSAPTKVQEHEKIVYQDRIVERKVYVKDENKKNNIVTVRLVTIKPDGTKTIETKTFDKTEIEITQKGNDSENETKTGSDVKDKLVENKKQDWLLSVLAKTELNTIDIKYGAMVNKRFLGPIYLGAFGFTDKSLGLGVGLGF